MSLLGTRLAFLEKYFVSPHVKQISRAGLPEFFLHKELEKKKIRRRLVIQTCMGLNKNACKKLQVKPCYVIRKNVSLCFFCIQILKDFFAYLPREWLYFSSKLNLANENIHVFCAEVTGFTIPALLIVSRMQHHFFFSVFCYILVVTSEVLFFPYFKSCWAFFFVR